MASPAYRAAKPLPPLERLHQLLSYDPETGQLRWRVTRGRIVRGSVAGAINQYGYVRLAIDYSYYQAHRIAWALHYGEDPGGMEIDHINSVKSDNRIQNLRLAARLENAKNRSKGRNNTSGAHGVTWHGKNRCWQATLKVGGKNVYCGCFATTEEAYEARKAAELRYHGEFAAHLGAERGQ